MSTKYTITTEPYLDDYSVRHIFGGTPARHIRVVSPSLEVAMDVECEESGNTLSFAFELMLPLITGIVAADGIEAFGFGTHQETKLLCEELGFSTLSVQEPDGFFLMSVPDKAQMLPAFIIGSEQGTSEVQLYSSSFHHPAEYGEITGISIDLDDDMLCSILEKASEADTRVSAFLEFEDGRMSVVDIDKEYGERLPKLKVLSDIKATPLSIS